MSPLVFMSVPYANAVILTRWIERLAPDARVDSRVPALLHDIAATGNADAALVPVVDYLFSGQLELVADIGIAADGPVESVLLKCDKPLEQVRTVAFDPASHTSNVLAELLLRDHWHVPVEWADEPARSDAAVTIGNRAMQLPPAADDRDLAEAWRALTGLPFVFAVWVCRRGHPRRGDMARILGDALDAGMADAPALAAEQARLLDLPPARCLHYITESIRYRIGEREHLAMQTFESMIRQHGHALSAMSRTASPRQ